MFLKGIVNLLNTWQLWIIYSNFTNLEVPCFLAIIKFIILMICMGKHSISLWDIIIYTQTCIHIHIDIFWKILILKGCSLPWPSNNYPKIITNWRTLFLSRASPLPYLESLIQPIKYKVEELYSNIINHCQCDNMNCSLFLCLLFIFSIWRMSCTPW